MKDKIRKFVRGLGLTPDIKGYKYIISSIEILCEDMDSLMTKEVYPTVAKTYNTTSVRVERVIRHAVDKLFNSYESIELLKNVFDCNFSSDHLTNSQFLCLCADTILYNEKKTAENGNSQTV